LHERVHLLVRREEVLFQDFDVASGAQVLCEDVKREDEVGEMAGTLILIHLGGLAARVTDTSVLVVVANHSFVGKDGLGCLAM